MTRQIDVRFPVSQIIKRGASAPLDTGTTVVIAIPFTASGAKPSFIRIAVSANSAYVALNTAATSATATTGDSIVTSTEALYLNCLGMNAVAARGASTPSASFIQISPIEDGVIAPPTVASVVG